MSNEFAANKTDSGAIGSDDVTLYANGQVAITPTVVSVSGVEYNISDIKKLSIDKSNWQTTVAYISAFINIFNLYKIHEKSLPLFIITIVFFIWGSGGPAWLVFRLSAGDRKVLRANLPLIRTVKSQIEAAQAAAAPPPKSDATSKAMPTPT